MKTNSPCFPTELLPCFDKLRMLSINVLALLQKPYTREDLTSKIRQILERQAV
jgi:hypothetical protein